VPLLSLPWFAMAFPSPRAPGFRPSSRAAAYGILVLALVVLLATKDFETQFPVRRVRRDATATVIAYGDGMNRRLLVNGMGMTKLTPITKMMAHLPLMFLDHPPQNALVVCFGMGTTYRSLLSWGIPVTAVELVPSVPRLFGYYHADGPALPRSPLSHVVIDDGRRYLERTPQQYDVIAIDPPPPVTAAGSSLLYSEEFYGIVKQHLRPGGILQQWLPGKDRVFRASAARALRESFPYLRVFPCLGGDWGIHILASTRPIPSRTAKQLLGRMPTAAITDMMEWGPEATPEAQLAAALNGGLSVDQVIAQAPDTPALKDDRPLNEYFLLRSLEEK